MASTAHITNPTAFATVIALPRAAKRKVRVPRLTGAELADRGIARIMPDGVEQPHRQLVPFNPMNPAHVRAWNSLIAFGRMGSGQ